ncbi:sigma-70 family RNA polymerase sigma factor [Heliobacterium gestii]|uniref:Sigma-70 family RNA polymerase sigma factor n=1 Tax=Heliomicrobium gestii TaxID=2699 RepID=A0A845LLT7_HELGE|nr:RNA polymerase sigma factor [Heliomicrobium gestii]MBM7868141.1 RNA polymerase sigma-70 factor (ECF subfamily) [Heliomicrobium gestii]MZP44333.1 sigma-70 family RNA polymerase sigma factor [Heliomicrobium gestii]
MRIEEMIEKLKAGDTDGLRHAYEQFYKSVYQAAFFILHDPDLAEDVTHDVFLKLGERIGQLRNPERLESWLCQMAVNAARDLLRRRVRNVLCAEIRDESETVEGSPETATVKQEQQSIVRRCISRLPPDYRSVIYLRFYLDQSIEQISATLDIPSGSVKSRLSRAKQRIRQWLERDGQDKRLQEEEHIDETTVASTIGKMGKEIT